MPLHQRILELQKNSGYPSTGGDCNGFGLCWLEAGLIEKEDCFEQEIELIESDAANQNTGKKHLPFLDSLTLYQTPSDFDELFSKGKSINQDDIETISSFASRDEIRALGGLKIVQGLPFIYNEYELKAYLDELGLLFEKHSTANKKTIGIKLVNHNHALALFYRPGKGWKFRDINQKKVFAQETQDTRALAQLIVKGFRDHPRYPVLLSPFMNAIHWIKRCLGREYISVNASLVITANDSRSSLLEEFEQLKSKQIISKRIARREGVHQLAYLYAKYGYNQQLIQLAELGVDLKKAHSEDSAALIAAQHGHLNVIQTLDRYSLSYNQLGLKGITPIYLAAQMGHTHILIENEATIDFKMKMSDGNNLFHIAACRNRYELFNLLAKHESGINEPNKAGTYPIHSAAYFGNAQAVGELIALGADVRSADPRNGHTAVHVAAERNHPSVIVELAKNAADLNEKNKDGLTPAIIAANKGHHRALKALIESGADMAIATAHGLTPLIAAAAGGHSECLEALAEIDDINRPSPEGLTPVFSAATFGHAHLIPLMAKVNANLDIADFENSPPLFIAALKGYNQVIAELANHGANVNYTDPQGSTAALMAAEAGHLDCVVELGKHSANLDRAMTNGTTPLYIAAQNGYSPIVSYLCESGVSIDHSIYDGGTPLCAAIQNNHPEVIKALIQHGANYPSSLSGGETFSINGNAPINQFINLFKAINQLWDYGSCLSKLEDKQSQTEGKQAKKLAHQLSLYTRELLIARIENKTTIQSVIQVKFNRVYQAGFQLMQTHRAGWKPLLINIGIAATGLGLVLLAGKLMVTGSAFFAQTQRQNLLKEVGKTCESGSLFAVSA
ncbi:Ankyrin repeat protein [Legionella birminghamensis]|uniref:Ankyrin repeat protein n=1 Tax=Legionella birminghamensis TaxID=28083 RepID=A0A378IA46_9GAMM|nr:ankyrin repeat domain-containing protein [Legionella birminghamensis]KTC75982.1 Ankyrin repeat protein [Legionella birminghamensis]STX32108.1 Ankyrin repeat protein [Legionella birminghamensis]